MDFFVRQGFDKISSTGAYFLYVTERNFVNNGKRYNIKEKLPAEPTAFLKKEKIMKKYLVHIKEPHRHTVMHL